ncbi:MAG TPA: hypothetical protein VI818_06675, partial [Candidatus Thermoplasmatota archaeon]|nr:hypothetical protein [Candidatus Thermoplasmatota archaeon]
MDGTVWRTFPEQNGTVCGAFVAKCDEDGRKNGGPNAVRRGDRRPARRSSLGPDEKKGKDWKEHPSNGLMVYAACYR